MLSEIIARLEPAIAWLAQRWPWFARLVNRFLINGIVMSARHRPHPWSTKTRYISWAGLTDRTYSARFLPEADLVGLPSDEAAAALFHRDAPEQRVCPKSTTLFPAFAQYLTDGFIRTMVSNNDALTDRRRTTTNHEIDLCPLYGRTEGQTNALRLSSEELGKRGRLKSRQLNGEEYPPALYDKTGVLVPEFEPLDEPLGKSKIPPEVLPHLFAVGGDRANATMGVAMINTLFLREHNRLAGLIEAAHPDWDDRHVFETTRNVVIVLFIKIVVEEYINHISPSRLRFLAEPSGTWRAAWNKPNWITAEFSLLYRWHSLVPDTIRWDGEVMPMANLRFSSQALVEAGLANAFVWMSAQPAAELGMGNTAEFLQGVELDAIRQARTNNIATYATYRAAMGLPPLTRWEELSSNPDIVRRLSAAYPGGIDTLEFYVGLFAETRAANSPLPPLILRMVAIDAFSQAMPNPLLSEYIWGDPVNQEAAFTREGLAAITKTRSLRDILVRNGADPGIAFVGMTRPEWKRDSTVQRAA